MVWYVILSFPGGANLFVDIENGIFKKVVYTPNFMELRFLSNISLATQLYSPIPKTFVRKNDATLFFPLLYQCVGQVADSQRVPVFPTYQWRWSWRWGLTALKVEFWDYCQQHFKTQDPLEGVKDCTDSEKISALYTAVLAGLAESFLRETNLFMDD